MLGCKLYFWGKIYLGMYGFVTVEVSRCVLWTLIWKLLLVWVKVRSELSCLLDELWLRHPSPLLSFTLEAESVSGGRRAAWGQLYLGNTENSDLCFVEMAQITSEEAEQESKTTSEQNSTGETAETGNEGQAVPDPKQEPGDNKENGAGMDVVNGGRGVAEKPGDNSPLVTDSSEETMLTDEKMDNGGEEASDKLSEPGKSPAQGSLASSTDSAQEGSRVLKPEQREGENVSSPPSDHTKTAEKAEHGTKRRASVELTSSDGEPLSRMDSEDRSVKVTLVNSMEGLALVVGRTRSGRP